MAKLMKKISFVIRQIVALLQKSLRFKSQILTYSGFV